MSGDPSGIEVVVEIMLTLLSQNKHILRYVVNCIFRVISDQLTEPALQSILAVLEGTDAEEEAASDDEDDDEDEEDGENNKDDEEEDEDDDEDEEESADEEEEVILSELILDSSFLTGKNLNRVSLAAVYRDLVAV